ncbi:MAG: DUF2752 domain-containing protein [Acidobacteriota bacterium]
MSETVVFPEPLAQRRIGPLALRLLPASHPSADLEVVAALVGALGLLGFWFLPLMQLAPFVGECRFKHWFGFPCGTCGITRAVLLMQHGDWGLAVRMNPLLVAGLMIAIGYTPVAWVLWLGKFPRPRLAALGRAGRWLLFGLAAGAFVINWGFLIADGR